MERWCLLLLLLTITSLKAEGQFLFQYDEGDACLMRSGRTGTCQRSCESLSTSGVRDRCGIKDSTFLVCCDRNPEGNAIVIHSQLDHAEGDTCITHSGRSGTCSRSCQHSPGIAVPRRCGIKGTVFLVCCDRILGSGPRRFTDISPPSVTFECGRNVRSRFNSNRQDLTDVLRHDDALRYIKLTSAEETQRFRRNDPGLPPAEENGVQLPPAEENGVQLPPAEENGVQLPPAEENGVQLPPAEENGVQLPPAEENGVQAIPLESPFFHTHKVEGGETVEANAWPWMALVGERTAAGISWFCGGVLISEQWVLTALHCFFHKTADVVRLGEHDYMDDYDRAAHEDFDVVETVLYPGYRRPEAYHDLALLRLASKVVLKEFIRPVCLPWGAESNTNITGQKATLAGWGDTEWRGSPSSILQEVNVTVFPAAQCDTSYSNLPHYPTTWPRGIGQETLCAGDPAGGRDACQGDSGGPLVTQDARKLFVLAAIVSRGYGCGHKDYPGLYANVRHQPYLAWIKKVAFATP